MSEPRNRHVAPDPAWILPLSPLAGVGVVMPSCTDRSDVLAVPIRTGQGLRIGGEAALCFRCGPSGSVYHSGDGYSIWRTCGAWPIGCHPSPATIRRT